MTVARRKNLSVTVFLEIMDAAERPETTGVVKRQEP